MEFIVGPDMSLAVAEALLDGVKKEATSAGCALSVVVVDRGGQHVATCRMDGAQLGATSIASDKAYTAVAFGHPTAKWAESSAPAGADWGMAGSLEGRCIVFPGGVPVFHGSDLIGAVGVSGAASSVDQACAENAVTSLGLATARA
ncbi:heme-binding protein [Nakamurella antarctica]|uniref:Heme-binding protein n=1 Tax=Nakamurella antarctica TaxID=1902245 RepID=A0A3G8ZJ90_9ACTN|nr:heme-binding protein [Nakamurella antarctica]AZI56905.1 heme-binding protein [Nakamurella antarctica]